MMSGPYGYWTIPGNLEVPERLEATPEEDTSPAEIMATLTPRERKVLQLLAEDLTT
jgi:hypothetical protein